MTKDNGRQVAKTIYHPLEKARTAIEASWRTINATDLSRSILRDEIIELKGMLDIARVAVDTATCRAADIGLSDDWMGRKL